MLKEWVFETPSDAPPPTPPVGVPPKKPTLAEPETEKEMETDDEVAPDPLTVSGASRGAWEIVDRGRAVAREEHLHVDLILVEAAFVVGVPEHACRRR